MEFTYGDDMGFDLAERDYEERELDDEEYDYMEDDEYDDL